MQSIFRATWVCVATTAFASAQTTWIVDALNGPGTNFLDIPAAVATAAPGDVVLVQAHDPTVATYQAPTISQALTVVGMGGQPALTGVLAVDALPAGQHVVLRSLAIGPFPGQAGVFGDCEFALTNNLGTVHLQNVDRQGIDASPSTANDWRIENCSLVTMAQCSWFVVGLSAVHRITGTSLCVATDCEFRSAVLPPLFGGTFVPTIDLVGSEMVLVDSDAQGMVSFLGGGGPAFSVCDATLRVGPGSGVSAGGQVAAFTEMAGCTQPTELRIPFGASIGSFVGIPFTTDPVVSLGATLTTPPAGPTSVLARLTGSTNDIAALAFGPPAATPAPLFGSLLFLDPTAMTPLAVVSLGGPHGTATWTANLPAGLPVGLNLWLQGAVLSGGIPTLTQPAVVTTL